MHDADDNTKLAKNTRTTRGVTAHFIGMTPSPLLIDRHPQQHERDCEPDSGAERHIQPTRTAFAIWRP